MAEGKAKFYCCFGSGKYFIIQMYFNLYKELLKIGVWFIRVVPQQFLLFVSTNIWGAF